MTTYATKAAAKLGAKRKGIDLETVYFEQNDEGRWYAAEIEAPEIEEVVIGEFIYCPNCKIHLSNGCTSHSDLLGDGKKGLNKFEFQCLACHSEFGPEIVRSKKAPTIRTGTGLKIEKDRVQQNGITRPSVGGKCAEIWLACDNFYCYAKRSPTPKEMKEFAAEEGFNENNAVIELYQWRKFMGITASKK